MLGLRPVPRLTPRQRSCRAWKMWIARCRLWARAVAARDGLRLGLRPATDTLLLLLLRLRLLQYGYGYGYGYYNCNLLSHEYSVVRNESIC